MFLLQAIIQSLCISSCLYLIVQAEALTYWLDSSCTDLTALIHLDEQIFDEVRHMASAGASQLKDPNDQVIAAAFSQIFKVDRGNAETFNQVIKAYSIISAMTPTLDHKGSDVRIYCDNDRRFELFPDNRSRIKSKRNSKLPYDRQTWWDPINYLFRPMGDGKGCLDDGTMAETYHITDPGVDTGLEAGHKLGRNVITICDVAFKGNKHLLLSSIEDTKLLVTDKAGRGLLLDDLDELLSLTIFHEFCHLKKVIAIPGQSYAEAFGWDAIMELDSGKAIEEADAYAWLAVLAVLSADKGVKLASYPGGANDGWLEAIERPEGVPNNLIRQRGVTFVG